MKIQYSERDSRGMLLVACCECERGGNGDASCSCGHMRKTWDTHACFSGTLLQEIRND